MICAFESQQSDSLYGDCDNHQTWLQRSPHKIHGATAWWIKSRQSKKKIKFKCVRHIQIYRDIIYACISIYMFNKYILLNLRFMRSKLDRTCSVLVHSCFRNVGLHIYEWATFWIKFGLLRYLFVFTHPPTPKYLCFVASRYLILKEPHSCFSPLAYYPSFQRICHSFGAWFVPLGLPHHRFACTKEQTVIKVTHSLDQWFSCWFCFWGFILISFVGCFSNWRGIVTTIRLGFKDLPVKFMGQQLDELNQGSRKRRLNSSASVIFRYTVI